MGGPNRLSDRNPTKAHMFTNSCSEPDKRRELTVSTYLKEKNFPEEECISQAEAARIRGVSRQAIARLIKKGRFRILRIGDKVFLDRREVQAYKPETSGRPPK
jgi:excisionase family DNA binding protein